MMRTKNQTFLRNLHILALLLTVGQPSAPAVLAGAQLADVRFEELSRLVAEKMAEYRITGVAFGVVKNGQVLARGFGVTNIEDPQPVTPETIFPVASISKLVAATAIMRLVEAGKIELHAPVRRYLPDFEVLDEVATHEVTVWNLLTHTPGWEGQLPTEDRGIQSLAYRTQTLDQVPQLAAPGAVWSYNNIGFAVLGRVIEVVTGKNIHEALRESVFAPLGLARTFTRLPDVVTHRFALGHRGRITGPIEVIRPFNFPTPNVTAGGVAMSVSDLLKFAQFHLDGITGTEGPVLSHSGLEQMRTPQLQKKPTDDEMGIGWHLRRLNAVLTAAHGGTSGAGPRVLVEIVPDRNLVFAILTNHVAGWRLIQDVERATLELYEGLALKPNQAIAYRGINEAMTAHASPLRAQPKTEAYIGTYRRMPLGLIEAREERGEVVITTGNAAGTPIVFYGRDLAYESANGTPYEFVRTPDGEVGWIRVNGRIARKDSSN